MESWFVPYQAGALPAARRVLVLAPHPDDEIFGCAGALLEYAEQGAQVEVAVLTDGAAGAGREARQRIAGRRRQETDAALAVLGLPPARFLGLEDRSLSAQGEALAGRIRGLLAAAHAAGRAVDVLFAPSLVEVHPDHAAAARACVFALQAAVQAPSSGAASFPCPQLLMYEVGTALAPNLLLDITRHWARKRQAMACFASQQALQDYARHIEGLNMFRTYTLGAAATHAEAYRRVLPEELAALAREAPAWSERGQYWSAAAQTAAQAECEALRRQVLALREEAGGLREQRDAAFPRRLLRPLRRLLARFRRAA